MNANVIASTRGDDAMKLPLSSAAAYTTGTVGVVTDNPCETRDSGINSTILLPNSPSECLSLKMGYLG